MVKSRYVTEIVCYDKYELWSYSLQLKEALSNFIILTRLTMCMFVVVRLPGELCVRHRGRDGHSIRDGGVGRSSSRVGPENGCA